MKRVSRPVGLAFVAAMLATLLPFSPGSASAQTDSSTIEICAGRQDAPLDVSLVLDKSGSIKNADPEQQRLKAVDAFFDGLLRLAEGDDGRDVRVSVWLFDTETELLDGVPEWQPIDNVEDVQKLSEAVEAGWNNDAVGGDTDQIIAFSEAFEQVERAQESSNNCSIVLMFTDGVLDTENLYQDEEDLPRVQSEACANVNLEGEPSLRERSHDLGTNEFVLMLEPSGNGAQFVERLTSTLTLFAAITGDTDIPRFSGDVQVTAGDLDCQPTYPETGEILSASDVGDLVASFLKLSAGVRGGQSAVESCPANIQDGTDALPAGGLIEEIDVISFQSGDASLALSDFTIKVGGTDPRPANTALEQVGSSTPEGFVLKVTDPAALPGGWKLQAKDDSEYCVELFQRTDLVVMVGNPDPLLVSEPDQVEDVDLQYNAPIVGEVDLTITMNGESFTSQSSTIQLPLDPEMRPDNVPIDSAGTLRALRVESSLFDGVQVTVRNHVTVADYSSDALPVLACQSAGVQIATGEVSESGAQTSDTTCSADPGEDVDGLRSFIRAESQIELPGRSTLTFTTSDGAAITDSWSEFSGQVDINSTVDGLPNQFYESTGTATFSVSYGETAETVTGDTTTSIELAIDIEPRSDRTVALAITALVTLLSGLLSLLLLWTFNRVTAQLPKAGDFFYYETGDPFAGPATIGDALDPRKLGAARGGRGLMQFGEVAVRLAHPPLWKPLADSIGVIDAPGAAAADPTGPREGTIPVGFASLAIGYRIAGLEDVHYVIVVPKTGPKSGIDGARSILNDRIRLERVAHRLPNTPEDGDTSDDGDSGSVSRGPGSPGSPGRRGKGSRPVPGGSETSSTPNHDDKNNGPSGPTLPGGSGPRLPS